MSYETSRSFPVSEVKISAELRTEFGKGGARRTRRAGKVPAVLYGHGEAPKHIALPVREFAAALRHGGINQIFSILLADGTQTLALTKAIQRDPVKDTFEHVDLVIVRRGERVTVDVPVHLVGEAAKGGLIVHEHDRVSVIAEALHLPEHLEVSIAGLGIGSHITAGAVKLPSGVELAADAELVLAVVTQAPTEEQLAATLPQVEVVEEAEEGEEAEIEAESETQEGAEAEAEEPAKVG
jgi:large subunit ribosomal protein L25